MVRLLNQLQKVDNVLLKVSLRWIMQFKKRCFPKQQQILGSCIGKSGVLLLVLVRWTTILATSLSLKCLPSHLYYCYIRQMSCRSKLDVYRKK